MRVIGLACAVPGNRVPSSDFVQYFGEETVEKIVANTGIHERRFVRHNGCTSDLCVAAAEALFEKTSIPRDTIDAVVFVTQSPDYYCVPATSCEIQHRLKLPETVFAFDIAKGCTGYTDGFLVAQGLLQGLGYRRILLLAGDTPSLTADFTNQGTCMLFGDAGSATILEKSDDPFIHVVGTDGTGALVINTPFGARNRYPMDFSNLHCVLDGAKVYEFTIDRVPDMVKEVLAKAGWSIADTDAFVFHQANHYIMRNLARMMKIPADKLPISLDEFGNTSSASIPLTIVTRLKERLQKSAKLVLVGFGVGLSWSAVAAEWEDTIVCPLVEVEC